MVEKFWRIWIRIEMLTDSCDAFRINELCVRSGRIIVMYW